MDKLMIFSGNAHPQLVQEIVTKLGINLSSIAVGRFSEGEVRVKINDNVRGKDVFVVQPTCPPVNENLMELLIMIDAFRRASARRITAVIPYYGYARQDRKDQPRVPITAKLVANLLANTGTHRVLTMDLHAGQIQGFFDIPLDHLYGINVFVDYFKKMKLDNIVVVAPDVGGIKMARAYAKRLEATLAILDKRRISPESTEVMHLLGDVDGKRAIIVDDILATGSSLMEAVNTLHKRGVKEIYATISHGILSGNAVERIEDSPLKELLITNTIPFSRKSKKIKVLSVAELLAEAIKRIHTEESISCLFDGEY